MTATCPVCNEYDGAPQQVQAHISGSSDELHQDRLGRDYENEIWADHRGNESADSENRREEYSTPTERELQRQRAGAVGSQQVDLSEEIDVEESSDESAENSDGTDGGNQPGVPLAVVYGLLVVVVVAVVASWWLQQPRRSPGERQTQRTDQEDGLVGRGGR